MTIEYKYVGVGKQKNHFKKKAKFSIHLFSLVSVYITLS